ncbi:MAG: hypothetical protein EB144_04120 [Actinobacteria bacterium]|nr:hypothetical protein [Actinomycetota bacterium]
MAVNSAERAVKNCAPWSKVALPMRRVAQRPPEARDFSGSEENAPQTSSIWPSMFAAMVGSIILKKLVSISHAAYDLTTSNLTHPVSYLSCIIGLIMILVSLFELRLKNKNIDIPLWSGGLISGFMGGLSGHQGALRSAFLVNKITNVGEFVATTAFIGLLTDIARNSVYLTSINWDQLNLKLLALTCAFAVIGVLFGTYLLKKLSIQSIQQMVSAGIFLLGLSMMLGLI